MSRAGAVLRKGLSVRSMGATSWSIALLGLASGTVLIPLNSTMLAIALPRIMTEFRVGAGTVSWLVTLYLITVALVMPISGSLGDRFGHRKMFVIGVTAFAVTSFVAAIAWSLPMLVVARVLQAASGASMTPNAASILRAIAPADRRGGSFGLLDMITSSSAAIGPFVGGLLVNSFGWRSMFVVAIPIALTAAIAVGAVVPADRPQPARARLDLAGLVLLSAFLLVLLAALSAGRGEPWAWPGVGLAGIFLALFIWRELQIPFPAVNVRLFRVWPFATAVAGVFGATIVLHATLVMIPILTQRLMQTSATTSGLVLLGLSGLSALTAPFGGRLSDRIGRRTPAVIGGVCMALGLGALAQWTGHTSIALLGVLLGIIGIGFGLSGSARQTSAIESVPLTATGMAAGMYYTGRYIGGAVGAGLAGGILGTALSTEAVARGFGVLTVVAILVAVVSLGLRGRGVEGTVVTSAQDHPG